MHTRSQSKPSFTDNNHNMITRSKGETKTLAKPQIVDSDIDFDGASRAWRANKTHVGNGHFEYVGVRTRSSYKM
jgi:hypothetical protein